VSPLYPWITIRSEAGNTNAHPHIQASTSTLQYPCYPLRILMRHFLMSSLGHKYADLAPFLIRVVVGLIFLLHGYQKLENGVGAVGGFLGGLGFPVPEAFAIILIFAEIVGGLMLIAGAFTYLAAKVLAFVALVAFLTVHVSHGFFVASGGYEFIILILVSTIAIAILGPGRWSVDKAMLRA
jgi:putative oxidoreductase